MSTQPDTNTFPAPSQPPPRRSQGADLAQLLEAANYDATQRGARFRSAPLSADVDLHALLSGASSGDDVLDLDAIATALGRLPLSELLGIDIAYLEAAGIADMQAEAVGDGVDTRQTPAVPLEEQRVGNVVPAIDPVSAASEFSGVAGNAEDAAPPPASATVDDVEAWLDSL